LLQERAGEAALGSAHEYWVGIMEPSVYAELVNLNLEGGAGVRLVVERRRQQLQLPTEMPER